MSKEQFDAKKPEIEAVTNPLTPNIPVDVALQESEDLWVWCMADKTKLTAAGLNWSLVEDLPARTGACRYIQSQWQKDYKSLEEAQKEWKLKSPEAYAMRDELLHHFFYAYYNSPDLYAKTQKIAEGNSHADMVQDLSDLAALGKAYPQPLQAISLDLFVLNQAEALSDEMAALLAKVNGNKLEDNKLRILRDKAYTFMKTAVDEIRRCGQYVFWRDEMRSKGYISQFLKKTKVKAKAITEADKG